jgi:microcystin-dependent protein
VSQPFIGQIGIFGFNFPPRNWAQCDGQLLPIAQNTALFSILGTTYGGNGTTTFGLPDLRGRVPLQQGQGPGLSQYNLGQQSGSVEVSLTANQIPAHNHAINASSNPPSQGAVANAVWAQAANVPYAASADASMSAAALGNAGGSQPHDNMAPSLALNFCIALQGIFPPRN